MNLFLLILVCGCFGYIKEGNTFLLIGNQYNSFLQEFRDNLRVVLLYEPFINSKKTATTEFFMASKQLVNTTIKLGKVDLADPRNKDIRQNFSKEPPHIFYCLAYTDNCKDYQESFDRKSFVTGFQDKIHSFESFHDIDDFDTYLSEKNKFDGIILGVFEDFKGEKYEAFLNFSKNFMDVYKFGLIKDEGEWAYKFDLKTDSIVIAKGKFLHNTLFPYYKSFSDFKNTTEIEDFVNKNYHPYLSYAVPHKLNRIKQNEVPFGMFFINFEKFYDKVPYFVEKFVYFSKFYAEADWEERKYQWAITNTKDYSLYIQDLGLENEDILMILEYKGKYYKIDQENIFKNNEFQENCLYNFFTKYEQQSYPEYFKTAAEPKENYENNVRIAVRSNFFKILAIKYITHAVFVYDSSKPNDYLWKLKQFEEVSAYYITNFRIDFIKIDALKNHLPGTYKNAQLPAVFFINGKPLHPELYYGGWELEDFKQKIDPLIAFKQEEL